MVPEPPGYREAEIAGGEHTPVGIAMLPWEDVRAAPDPRALVLGFLESAYEAAFTSRRSGCRRLRVGVVARAGLPPLSCRKFDGGGGNRTRVRSRTG